MPGTAIRPVRTSLGVLALVVLFLSAVLLDGVRASSVQGDGVGAASVSHLVISELLAGGASASDEFVELYNPSGGVLPLDGVELIYVTASGATITRKASWGSGVGMDPGEHLLVANEAGIFAGVADATYAGGLAATGGSLALRILGGSTAIDAVGWGTAASVWLETAPAPAPAAGSSLERLPGGELGSGQDTDHNLVDFIVRPAPDPQNSTSPPVPSPTTTPGPTDTPEPTPTPGPTDTPEPTPTPGPTDTPEPTATATLSPTPSPTATPAPTPAPLTVAEARAMPDGAMIVVAGVATTSSDFTEGGGYLADATGGIAVLLSGGTFARGDALVISGTIDDRYAQRTIRADASGVMVIGAGVAPVPTPMATGNVGETVEAQLVTLEGIVQGLPTILTSGEAFEVDDGSGPIRVLVGPGAGIDTSAWQPGSTLSVTGVVGQRDSTGTGTEGYRVQPRDPNDVGVVLPPATPAPSQSVTPSPSATPPPSQPALVTIADARTAEVGTQLRIRGVVTLNSALLDPDTAVVADPSGAILVRTGSEVGRLVRGQLVELTGARSTKSGMASLRVTDPALALGTQAEPDAVRRPTGAIGEGDEATLVIVRGIVGDGPRRTTGGGLSFTLNDGSRPVRVFAPPASAITAPHLPAGAWVELRAVVGQETTGAEPNAGYRLWPRDRADVTLIAGPVTPTGKGTQAPTRSFGPLPAVPSMVAVPLLPPELSLDATPTPTVRPAADPPPEPASSASRIPIPLAGGTASGAGLLALAWRHGTLQRLADAIRRAMEAARSRVPGAGDEEGDAYTPAP
jgi:hypothetical protein